LKRGVRILWNSLGGDYLANKIRRYLLQHPYIETLSINAFNAGRRQASGLNTA
jgi:hypothetical protein